MSLGGGRAGGVRPSRSVHLSRSLSVPLVLLPQIFRSLPPGYNITKAVLEQCLALMADDPVRLWGAVGCCDGVLWGAVRCCGCCAML